jgi:MFS family permease
VPAHLHGAFGLSLGAAGAVTALYGLGGVAWALNARWLIPRLGERGLATGGGALLFLGMGLLAFAGTWAWAAPGCLLGGFGLYMLHSTLQTHATQMAPEARGTAVALFALALFGGQSLGVAAGAFVLDHGSPRIVFGAAMLLLPVLALGFGRMLDQHHRPS